MQLEQLFTTEHSATYYDDVLKHHKLIIKTVRNTNQKSVAKTLGITEPKFSAMYRLLLAYADEKANANT